MKTNILRNFPRWIGGILIFFGVAACNDMGYNVIDNAVYISEATDNMLQKVIVDETGGKASVSVRTNQKAAQDIMAVVELDAVLLDNYNNKMGTAYPQIRN